MLQEQAEELVRFGYDWFNRWKEPPPLWHPDGEFINAREDPDHTTYRGIDAIRKQHQGWFDAYRPARRAARAHVLTFDGQVSSMEAAAAFLHEEKLLGNSTDGELQLAPAALAGLDIRLVQV
jgi:hypothetical protein